MQMQSEADCLKAKSTRSAWSGKPELNGNVDSETSHGGSSRRYVLHQTGCSKENNQLLRSKRAPHCKAVCRICGELPVCKRRTDALCLERVRFEFMPRYSRYGGADFLS